MFLNKAQEPPFLDQTVWYSSMQGRPQHCIKVLYHLPTLRTPPYGCARMTRGRCNSIGLHRMKLSFTTFPRFDLRTNIRVHLDSLKDRRLLFSKTSMPRRYLCVNTLLNTACWHRSAGNHTGSSTCSVNYSCRQIQSSTEYKNQSSK